MFTPPRLLPVCEPRRRARAAQRGLSLVELMVGIAIGLFIVAAASLVASSQLNDNRRLMLELQVQQDLRATADIVTRELRRAGYWDVSQDAVSNVAINPTGLPQPNLNLPLVVNGTPGSVQYKYKRLIEGTGGEGPYGFRLDNDGVIRTRITFQSGWQELTDINTLVVDTFTVDQTNSTAVKLPCPKDCPGAAGDDCWPTVAVREFTVTITGHAPTDSAITRTVTTQVRLRNDEVNFLLGGGLTACPV
jgi:prepilin-type N-terminal cleavage/methylation domain-containing protein